MFQAVEREFSITRWIGQLLLAYCVPALLVALAESLFRTVDTPIWQASDYLLIGLMGALAGVGIYRLTPDSAREGVWVWALPTAALAAGMIYDAFSSAGCFPCTFYAAQGDPNPMPVILTLPTWGCICYSAAIYWRGHPLRTCA